MGSLKAIKWISEVRLKMLILNLMHKFYLILVGFIIRDCIFHFFNDPNSMVALQEFPNLLTNSKLHY